jgi:hypothetical protein
MASSGRKGRANARSNDRERLRTLEDTLALLLDVDQERVTIKRTAWELGQPDIYQASERQRKALERLKAALSERWYYLMDDLNGVED